jgi:hypothetical protein
MSFFSKILPKIQAFAKAAIVVANFVLEVYSAAVVAFRTSKSVYA